MPPRRGYVVRDPIPLIHLDIWWPSAACAKLESHCNGAKPATKGAAVDFKSTK